jgi:hypothetical protein
LNRWPVLAAEVEVVEVVEVVEETVRLLVTVFSSLSESDNSTVTTFRSILKTV